MVASTCDARVMHPGSASGRARRDTGLRGQLFEHPVRVVVVNRVPAADTSSAVAPTRLRSHSGRDPRDRGRSQPVRQVATRATGSRNCDEDPRRGWNAWTESNRTMPGAVWATRSGLLQTASAVRCLHDGGSCRVRSPR
jgi:hypothetical protein